VSVSLAGRIFAVRSSSAKLQFYDLHGEGAKVQVMFNQAFASDSAAYECVRGARRPPSPRMRHLRQL
jgi:lysyl-tRNA synthetase class 2